MVLHRFTLQHPFNIVQSFLFLRIFIYSTRFGRLAARETMVPEDSPDSPPSPPSGQLMPASCQLVLPGDQRHLQLVESLDGLSAVQVDELPPTVFQQQLHRLQTQVLQTVRRVPTQLTSTGPESSGFSGHPGAHQCVSPDHSDQNRPSLKQVASFCTHSAIHCIGT